MRDDEIRLCLCIGVAVMLKLFFKAQLQSFILPCGIRIAAQIISKIELPPIPHRPNMQMIYLVRKTIWGVSFVTCYYITFLARFTVIIIIPDQII